MHSIVYITSVARLSTRLNSHHLLTIGRGRKSTFVAAKVTTRRGLCPCFAPPVKGSTDSLSPRGGGRRRPPAPTYPGSSEYGSPIPVPHPTEPDDGVEATEGGGRHDGVPLSAALNAASMEAAVGGAGLRGGETCGFGGVWR